MNINEEIQKLENITGLPVSPDEYTGTKESYIVYAYDDERPVYFGDDEVMADTADIQVNLYTPAKLNYMELKHKVRDYLETLGIVTSIISCVETYNAGGSKNQASSIRHTAFDVSITKER